MNRLFEIVYLLLEKKTITAPELAQHFEVSVRTIYRDIETLSMSGIPVYASRGKNGGFSLLDNFVLDKSIISKDEQYQILTALQSLQEVEKNGNCNVLNKLHSIFKITDPNWLSIDFSDWSNNNQEIFSIIKSAIVKRHIIKFEYYNRSGEKSTRTVEPLQLWLKEYTWFLRAFCREKQAYRVFKLTRIKKIEYIDETYNLRSAEEFDANSMNLENVTKPNISFVMKIASCMAYRVYDTFDDSEIEIDSDENFIVSATYPFDEWIYGMILSYGSHAEVLYPNSLRNSIKEILKKSLDNYL